MKNSQEFGLQDTLFITEKNVADVKSSLITAYKSVFNASAWREWVKCSGGCGFKASFEESPDKCPNCSANIEDFYSDEEVGAAISGVLARKDSSMTVFLPPNATQVVAFVWGWVDTILSINEEKLGLSREQLADFCQKSGIGDARAPLYYTSEMGVVPEWRGEDMGNQLFYISENARKTRFRTDGILRTSQDSPMLRISTNAGYREVWTYGDADKRTLLFNS